jgi:hypothetical protein
MGLLNRGDNVTVVRDNHPEPGSRSYVGATGTVTGADSTSVGVRLDGDTSSTGFEPGEVERR